VEEARLGEFGDFLPLASIGAERGDFSGERTREHASAADHVRDAGWEYLHIAIDDHSRLAFAQLLPDETAASAITFLPAALAFFQKHGVQTQRVYSGNGSCYRAHAMREALAALGLKHRFTRPDTPKTNGKASASSRPRSANGPTLTLVPTPTSAYYASRFSSTTTTGIVLTTPSISALPSPDSASP